MGQLMGDHKIMFGKAGAGRVLFMDIGEVRGQRTVALFSTKTIGNVESYTGHVLLANAQGLHSPQAHPVQFSVPAGEDERAMGAVLTACTHISQRSILPDWDGHSVAAAQTVADMTKRISNFSGEDIEHSKKTDPRVVRTSLPMSVLRAAEKKAKRKKDKDAAFTGQMSIMPLPGEIGVNIGLPEDAHASWEVSRKIAGAAAKVGYGPIVAPKIDKERAVEALAAVAHPQVFSADYYGGAGTNLDDPQDTRVSDRTQAAKSFPVLAEFIANSPDLKKAIDAREPMQPLLIEKTGLSKGALKRLSKITQPFNAEGTGHAGHVMMITDQLGVNRNTKFIVNGGLSLETALEHVKDLPPDWVPDSDQAWSDFSDILGGLAIPLAHVTGKSVKELLSAAKGDWKGFKATLAKAADVPVETFNRAQMSAMTGQILEMTETLARTAIMPMVAAIAKRADQSTVVIRSPELIDNTMEKAVAAAPHVIIGRSKSPMVALLEAQRKFISRDAVIAGISTGLDEDEIAQRETKMTDKERQMGDMAGNKAFPVLRETWTASNGYQVVPFRNEEDMRTEGTLMKHCVGTNYARTGSSGAYHFFSVRHPDTMHIPQQRGTLRLSPVSPGGKIQEAEFRSYGNGNVTAACRAALKEWTESFLQEDLDAAGARMDEWREWRRVHGMDTSRTERTPDEIWQSKIDVKMSDNGIENVLWTEWATNVLSGWPESSPEVMFRNPEIRDLIFQFSPATADFLKQEAAERKAAEANAQAPAPAM